MGANFEGHKLVVVGGSTMEEVMRSAKHPPPNAPPHEMVHFMEEHNLRTALVTTSEGRLIAPFKREDGDKP